MAGNDKQVLVDVQIWLGGLDISSWMNELQAPIEASQHEVTTFGSGGWADHLTGVKRPNWSYAGFWGSDATTEQPDKLFTEGFPVAGTPPSPLPSFYSLDNPAAENDLAYYLRVHRLQYSHPAALDSPARFTLGLASLSPAVRGAILGTWSGLAAPASSTGKEYTGGITSTQRGYAGLSVPAFTGTSATVKIQSDTTSGFSAPTDRITFASVTAAESSEHAELAGPVTDPWWRVDVSGVFTAVTLAIFFGIQ